VALPNLNAIHGRSAAIWNLPSGVSGGKTGSGFPLFIGLAGAAPASARNFSPVFLVFSNAKQERRWRFAKAVDLFGGWICVIFCVQRIGVER
jgi:hypothetical protein